MTHEELIALSKVVNVPQAEILRAMREIKEQKRREQKRREPKPERKKATPAPKPSRKLSEDGVFGMESTRNMHKMVAEGSEKLLAALKREHPEIIANLTRPRA